MCLAAPRVGSGGGGGAVLGVRGDRREGGPAIGSPGRDALMGRRDGHLTLCAC